MTWKLTEPLYQLEKSGGMVATDPRAKTFVQSRLAAGATALRDLVTEDPDAVKPFYAALFGWQFEEGRALERQPARVFAPEVAQDAGRIADAGESGWHLERGHGAPRQQHAKDADVRNFLVGHAVRLQ